MPHKLHTGLLAAVAGLHAAVALGQQPTRVQTRVFDVAYTLNEAAQPLDSVQLWYTLDRGTAWHQYGLDEDRQSPISFHAPSEGLYGFFIVAINTAGVSSGPPTRETGPHRWAFVDFTPPVVQLHDLRPTTIVGRRGVQIRWTAIDPNFPARPVEISYQRLPNGPWQPVTPDSLANTGRYDWRLPDGLVGPVAVRVAVRDEGDHHVVSEPRAIECNAPGLDRGRSGAPNPAATPTGDPTHGVRQNLRTRAKRLLAEGRTYRERGALRPAIARMREAVKADPSLTEAFAEMAAMLYRIGDFDRALDAYAIALEQRPSMRPALRGAAMIHRQKEGYAKAAELLQTILRYNPNDAETWMNLGDVAVFEGDEIRARECYQRATQMDPAATQVIEQAHKRLTLMAEVARTYHPTGR